MRDVVTNHIVNKEHRKPYAYDRKYEIHPVVLAGSNLYSKQFLNDAYQGVKHICCQSSKYADKEGKDKDEFLVREVLLPPGEDII